MRMEHYCRLAAAIFTLIALAQLARALAGVEVMAGRVMIPLWLSWLAAIVLALLAWLGFTARRA